jgi:sulfite exporter TauE/SafE
LSDLFSHFSHSSLIALPWIAFLAGLGGSVHCVGMCGGLVSATSKTRKEIWSYQLGRLLGYSLLGLFGGTLGHLFSRYINNHITNLLPAITLGGLFIIWGLKTFNGQKKISKPNIFSKLRSNIWSTLIPTLPGPGKSFGVGLFSILLPCGFLYSMIIVVTSFHDPIKALIATFFFWVGTLPALTIAPELLVNYLKKFLNSSPKILGSSFMIIGILTIAYRINMSYQTHLGASCH